MNINSVNNPMGRSEKPVDKGEKVSSARPEELKKAESTQKQTPEIEAAEQAKQDTVQISRNQERIEELTDTVDSMEDVPREEVIARARERAENGYYDSPEVIARTAKGMVYNNLING